METTTESLSYTSIDLPTKIQSNLLKLAMYLLSGNLRADFDMSTYDDQGRHYRYFCGTVGCAIGHGPYAGIPKSNTEHWIYYGMSNFTNNSIALHHWLFHYTWESTDNTPEGTAKRILYTLKFGLPNNWREQMGGTSTLIYNKFDVDYLLKD